MNDWLTASVDYAAYIPCYAGGNAVMAVRKDGQTITINMGIKYLLGKLLKRSSLDIGCIRENYSKCVNRSNLIPIPLSLETVLIPIRVRKSIGSNDGSYAYIDSSNIEAVVGLGNAVIKLKCGFEINCIEPVSNVKKKINMGEIIREKFTSSTLGEAYLKEGISEISQEYSKAATKGDIALLTYEIIQLRRSINK